MKLDAYLLLCTKINVKWIKGLNVKLETQKLLEGNTGAGKDSDFAQESQPATDEWDLIKLKHFSTAKQAVNHVKTKPVECERLHQL